MDSQKIRKNGWHQGAVFKIDDTEAVSAEFNIECPEYARLVVLSHDCDIVHAGDFEPNVEIGILRIVHGNMSGNNTFGKNPRLLHIGLQGTDVFQAFELGAAQRFFIPREILERYAPDESQAISTNHIDHIRRWLANRYNRAALPDAFNERISSIWRDPVRRELKRKGKYISGLYIALVDWGELSHGEVYETGLLATMETDDYITEDRRVEAGEALGWLATALSGCDGISLGDHELRSERDVSLDDRRNYVRLNFDDLSLREERGRNIAPE